jgi:class 3 adenylate cyclase
VRVTNGRCTLGDAGSTYGTQLNGAPLRGEAQLESGDVFQSCSSSSRRYRHAICSPRIISCWKTPDRSSAASTRCHARRCRPIASKRRRRLPLKPRPYRRSRWAPQLQQCVKSGAKESTGRKQQLPFAGPERRSGRDRRQLRFLRLLSEISKTRVAVCGAPFPQADHADRAIEAALAMRQALREINRDFPQYPIQMRIALNSGVAITGDIGSPRRREFTMLGDVVNACSRIESSVCKRDQIVCSRATVDRTTRPFNTKSLGTFSLRGRQADMELFEVN